ncbi:MAG: PfkB family carbohydrate kinase [Sulfitobacter sp.]
MAHQKRPIRKIACVGEVMVELRSTGPDAFKAGVAGDTYNTAVYLSRALMETDVAVSYVTALGTDEFSERIVGVAKGHGFPRQQWNGF